MSRNCPSILGGRGQPAGKIRQIGGELVAKREGPPQLPGPLGDLFVLIRRLPELGPRLGRILGRIAEEEIFPVAVELVGTVDSRGSRGRSLRNTARRRRGWC